MGDSKKTLWRVMWVVLCVAIIALIISIVALIIALLKTCDCESQMMKERTENNKRFADIQSEMNKSREDFDKQCNCSSMAMNMSSPEKTCECESQMMKERTENNKRFADIEREMNKSREDFDKQCNCSSMEMNMSSPENSTGITQVAFSVGSEKAFKPTMFTRIPMEVEIYNPGNYFENDNAFHAPMKGVYSFHFGAVSRERKETDIHLYTEKVGQTKVHVARAYDSTLNGFSGATASVMVQMDKDETAWVELWGNDDLRSELYGGGSAPGGPTTLFMGKLEYRLD